MDETGKRGVSAAGTPGGCGLRWELALVEHPYGFLSLLPPVAAIVLAIATRRVVLSLLTGVFAGALVTTGGNPFPAVADTLEIHLWKTLADESKLRVFAFTLLSALNVLFGMDKSKVRL